MGSIADLRKLVEDRKAEGLPTDTFSVCLDPKVARKYAALEAERARIVRAGSGSLAGPDTDDVDAQMEELREHMTAQTVGVVFRALSGEDYQTLLNQHRGVDSDPEVRSKFGRVLMLSCYQHVLDADGDQHDDFPLADIIGLMTHADLDAMAETVFKLNRTRVDVPFSGRPSAQNGSGSPFKR